MKKIAVLLLMCELSTLCFAQAIDDVSLVVTGTGESKESAVQNALRSAVEQAYGAFVSSNTTILNDELVKDEIATVSSGNIKSYTEIDNQRINDNSWIVSLRAVVSTSALTSYAKSKGASCEFAGAVFGANLKLAKLNQQNTQIALQHMVEVFKQFGENLFDYSLSVGNPDANGRFTIEVQVLPNETTVASVNFLYKTLKELSITVNEYDQLNNMKLSPGYIWVYNKGWEKLYLYQGVDWKAMEDIYAALWEAVLGFKIMDNLGSVYSFPPMYLHFSFDERVYSDERAENHGFGALRDMHYTHESRNARREAVPFRRNYGKYEASLMKIEPFSYIVGSKYLYLPGGFILEDSKPKKGKQKKESPSSLSIVGRAPLYSIKIEYKIPVETLTTINEFKVVKK